MNGWGYEFKNAALLKEALTTPACRITNPKVQDNQRLEFLGDAVLGMLAAERLYAEFPNETEGTLSVRRTHMVSTAALCAAAERIEIGGQLRRNKGAQELPRGSKTFADAIEALIGAAYLDGGYAAAKKIFEALALEVNAEVGAWSENPKGELQIRVQAMTPPRRPLYTLLKRIGKAHEPVFTVKVSVEGIGEATASAHTRKEAESKAADILLKRKMI